MTRSYRVYEFRSSDRYRLADELAVEPIWRLGYAEREARHFGIDRETFFVMLEGDERALDLADAVLLRFGRKPQQQELFALRMRAEDAASAAAIGSVFGPVVPPAGKTGAGAPGEPKEGVVEKVKARAAELAAGVRERVARARKPASKEKA